jgi:hypothetical protein
MHNLRFWNNVVGLIDSLASIESGVGDSCVEDVLNTFSEAYRGSFEPNDDFEEYVLVALIGRVGRIISAQNSELP